VTIKLAHKQLANRQADLKFHMTTISSFETGPELAELDAGFLAAGNVLPRI
jgi:hypothetical protein